MLRRCCTTTSNPSNRSEVARLRANQAPLPRASNPVATLSKTALSKAAVSCGAPRPPAVQ
uniref:Uncharacterized protein n=1 Tax=Myoviridae sp. ct4uh47 TaxID=2825032 RepID=A0A8S5V5Y3_9CAUD|nr:MAG TPA: hypothetical protein [Myoviridae sp. ct4uh47]